MTTSVTRRRSISGDEVYFLHNPVFEMNPLLVITYVDLSNSATLVWSALVAEKGRGGLLTIIGRV